MLNANTGVMDSGLALGAPWNDEQQKSAQM
jgi:hypothetical protein